MDTAQLKIGTILATALKLPWYMFVIGVTVFSKTLKWMKVPDRKPEVEEHRMSQTGATENVMQQMA